MVRNDKLGDFMLAWPAFALLKHHLPTSQISALVPEYTAPMARLCPWIDHCLIDPAEEDGSRKLLPLLRRLRQQRFDAVVTLFSTGRVALASCLAGIPYRLAPATKLAQFCYNHRLTQHRSRSEKPEYAYNLDLAYRLLKDFSCTEQVQTTRPDEQGDYLPDTVQRPLLAFDAPATNALRTAFCAEHGFPEGAKLVFIHPGSGGSANNLGTDQYAELARRLTSTGPLAFVISAGPGEEQHAQRLQQQLVSLPVAILQPEGGLRELAEHLAFTDLFISGSTGPLHIAGALNRNTATFYPRHRSGSPLRWQSLNAPEKQLALIPPNSAAEKDVGSIDVVQAAERISRRFLQ